MNCPKCQSAMALLAFEDIVVDRCTSCRGIWFDAQEHTRLAKMKGSEAIDIGDPAIGKKQNLIGDIDCPVCHSPMIRMVDLDQPHIWYESCKVCKGVYFDAGEFKDFSKRTFADFFRDLFAKERP